MFKVRGDAGVLHIQSKLSEIGLYGTNWYCMTLEWLYLQHKNLEDGVSQVGVIWYCNVGFDYGYWVYQGDFHNDNFRTR